MKSFCLLLAVFCVQFVSFASAQPRMFDVGATWGDAGYIKIAGTESAQLCNSALAYSGNTEITPEQVSQIWEEVNGLGYSIRWECARSEAAS